MQPQSFLEFFKSPALAEAVFILKIISGIISAAASIGIIVVIIKTLPMRQKIRTKIRMGYSPEGSSTRRISVREDWANILAKAGDFSEENAKAVITEADTLVEGVLKRIGIYGRDMEERMNALRGQLSSLADLQELHALRSNIERSDRYIITEEALKNALYKYESILKELDVL